MAIGEYKKRAASYKQDAALFCFVSKVDGIALPLGRPLPLERLFRYAPMRIHLRRSLPEIRQLLFQIRLPYIKISASVAKHVFGE